MAEKGPIQKTLEEAPGNLVYAFKKKKKKKKRTHDARRRAYMKDAMDPNVIIGYKNPISKKAQALAAKGWI